MSESQNSQAALTDLAARLRLGQADLPLLQQALTHPAFFEGGRHPGEDDNQRLEFLGDAVLDLLIGAYLFQRYPEAREGALSKMRAFIVREATLAQAAQELGVDAALRLGRGSEAGGDRTRASVLADAFEAVVGAVYVRQGAEAAQALLLSLFRQRMDSLTTDDYEDKKSLLQELVQAKAPRGVVYRQLAHSGPDHAPHFTCGVYCGSLLLAQGEGGSKKEAETAAAAAALSCRACWLELI